MVDVKAGWKCPYCNHLYDKEYEARDCANDCVEVDSPIEVSLIYCSMCNEKYCCIQEAEDCELKHMQHEDKAFKDYQIKKNFEALAKAASHPGQLKLGDKVLTRSEFAKELKRMRTTA